MRPSKACPPSAPGWTFKTFNLSAGSHSKTPAKVALHCFVHMEEVKKLRGSLTECIENQSSLLEASVLKYLKLPRMLWATFCRHAFTLQLRLPNESGWIQLILTSDALINMHSNIALACSGLLDGQKLWKMDTSTHVFTWQCCSNGNKLRKHPAVHSLPFLHTHARIPSSLWNFQMQTKVALQKFKIISISQNHPKSPFPWSNGSINGCGGCNFQSGRIGIVVPHDVNDADDQGLGMKYR